MLPKQLKKLILLSVYKLFLVLVSHFVVEFKCSRDARGKRRLLETYSPGISMVVKFYTTDRCRNTQTGQINPNFTEIRLKYAQRKKYSPPIHHNPSE